MTRELLPHQMKRFRTLEEAKDFLSPLEDRYVFRGMGCARWDLLTTLDRAANYRHLEAEKVLVESFQKAYPEHVADVPVPSIDDRVSWLALMRHYGLPCRLLDCTASYKVAAYFAAETSSNCELAIWAIQKKGLQFAVEAALGILNTGRNDRLSPLELGGADLFSATFLHPKRFVALVDANHKTPRQRAQQALFLCPGDPSYYFWLNFCPQVGDTPGLLYQIVLPPAARDEIIEDLRGTDINCANLLPDTHRLSGLCDTLKTQLGKSQELYGHFQWHVQIRPLLMDRGLLDVELT